jgi:hypothetical protein
MVGSFWSKMQTEMLNPGKRKSRTDTPPDRVPLHPERSDSNSGIRTIARSSLKSRFDEFPSVGNVQMVAPLFRKLEAYICADWACWKDKAVAKTRSTANGPTMPVAPRISASRNGTPKPT